MTKFDIESEYDNDRVLNNKNIENEFQIVYMQKNIKKDKAF